MFSSYFRQFCQRLQKVPPKKILLAEFSACGGSFQATSALPLLLDPAQQGFFAIGDSNGISYCKKKLHISSFPKIWSLCLSKRIFLFYCLKSCIQSCDKIFYFLNSNGKTDGIWLDSLIQKLFLCALTVCCSCRMDNKRFYICNICQQ